MLLRCQQKASTAARRSGSVAVTLLLGGEGDLSTHPISIHSTAMQLIRPSPSGWALSSSGREWEKMASIISIRSPPPPPLGLCYTYVARYHSPFRFIVPIVDTRRVGRTRAAFLSSFCVEQKKKVQNYAISQKKKKQKYRTVISSCWLWGGSCYRNEGAGKGGGRSTILRSTARMVRQR